VINLKFLWIFLFFWLHFFYYRYNEGIELEDAIHTAILTLKEGFEGQMTENNIEIGIVNQSRQFRVLTPSEIRDYLGEAE
jgi:20S proteasome subunit alpha 2